MLFYNVEMAHRDLHKKRWYYSHKDLLLWVVQLLYQFDCQAWLNYYSLPLNLFLPQEYLEKLVEQEVFLALLEAADLLASKFEIREWFQN